MQCLIFQRRKSIDSTVDSMGNNIPNAPSKHELKKALKANRRNRKKQRESSSFFNSNRISEENKGNVAESGKCYTFMTN